jgi:hypothetical protein
MGKNVVNVSEKICSAAKSVLLSKLAYDGSVPRIVSGVDIGTIVALK